MREAMATGQIARLPSAWLPIVMSSVALAVVLSCLLLFGVTRTGDEGAVAHLWQLLMTLQVPIVAYFCIRWLPRAPKRALGVLVLQLTAALAAMAPVYLLGL